VGKQGEAVIAVIAVSDAEDSGAAAQPRAGAFRLAHEDVRKLVDLWNRWEVRKKSLYA